MVDVDASYCLNRTFDREGLLTLSFPSTGRTNDSESMPRFERKYSNYAGPTQKSTPLAALHVVKQNIHNNSAQFAQRCIWGSDPGATYNGHSNCSLYRY